MFATTWEEFNQKAIEFYQTYDQKKRKNIENILLETDRDKHPYNINWTTRQVENAYSAMLAQ
jgi:Txe/YoeB family toxin of Txe-Axe toxin-antitoxin module